MDIELGIDTRGGLTGDTKDGGAFSEIITLPPQPGGISRVNTGGAFSTGGGANSGGSRGFGEGSVSGGSDRGVPEGGDGRTFFITGSDGDVTAGIGGRGGSQQGGEVVIDGRGRAGGGRTVVIDSGGRSTSGGIVTGGEQTGSGGGRGSGNSGGVPTSGGDAEGGGLASGGAQAGGVVD